MNSAMIDVVVALVLGTALGAGAAYLLLRERLRDRGQAGKLRAVAMLEQVAEHVGRVSHVFSKYSSLVSDVGPRAERMSPNQEQELETLSNELVRVYEEAAVAESKLLLLGEQRLEKALKLYTAKMAQYRRQIYPGRYQNTEEASALRKEVADMKTQFYDILSERFDQRLQ